jgi:hypothetical protein
MSDSDIQTSASDLRLERVKALDQRDLFAIMLYLLARHPDTFPAMLDDALASVGPASRG